MRKVCSNPGGLDLLLEYVHLVEEEDEGAVTQPLVLLGQSVFFRVLKIVTKPKWRKNRSFGDGSVKYCVVLLTKSILCTNT
jgi:hypothetical protein